MSDITSSLAGSELFTPLRVGNIGLQHRIAMAPLTRMRAYLDQTPSEIALTYYEQRASVPGTLLFTEATFIGKEAGGYNNIPGIYNAKQIAAWRKITDAVHAKGSFIYLQLWALGRAANPEVLKADGYDVISSSNLPMPSGGATPRPLTSAEIKKWIGLYVQAAKNSIEAGFDGVEIHGANGYLIDQFLQDVCNNRTDEYGGSVENRARFALEVAEAVTAAVGQERTGIRLSPWNNYNDMRMADPIPTFSYLVEELKKRFPRFSYIHVVEPRVMGNDDVEPPQGETNDLLRQIWSPKVYLSAGGFTEKASGAVPKMGDVIVYGRWFISNPDLPLRLKEGIPFSNYNRGTFYLVGPDQSEGYTDYPTAKEIAEQGN